MVNKLVYLRKRYKLTTEEISVRSGIPVGTLNKIFSGATKNPALQTMVRLAEVFDVPVRYLVRNEIPLECSYSAYTEGHSLLNLNAREVALLQRYRKLNESDKHYFDIVLEDFSFEAEPSLQNAKVRHLPCYVAISAGQRGAYADAFRVVPLITPITPITLDSDFAVKVVEDSLEPIYSINTVLAVKRVAVKHNQLGVFILNGEGFVRKLYDKKGVRKLVPVNLDQPVIPLTPQDQFRCMGVVRGAIRTYHWK